MAAPPAKLVGGDRNPISPLRIAPEKGKSGKLPAITSVRWKICSSATSFSPSAIPFGVGQTVTMGIVSALGRSHSGHQHLREFHPDRRRHQPGNSGGHPVDSRGNLIWHQHGNLLAFRRLAFGIGFCHSDLDGSQRHGADHSDRHGDARLDRCRGTQKSRQNSPKLWLVRSRWRTHRRGATRQSRRSWRGVRPGDILLSVNGKPVRIRKSRSISSPARNREKRCRSSCAGKNAGRRQHSHRQSARRCAASKPPVDQSISAGRFGLSRTPVLLTKRARRIPNS